MNNAKFSSSLIKSTIHTLGKNSNAKLKKRLIVNEYETQKDVFIQELFEEAVINQIYLDEYETLKLIEYIKDIHQEKSVKINDVKKTKDIEITREREI